MGPTSSTTLAVIGNVHGYRKCEKLIPNKDRAMRVCVNLISGVAKIVFCAFLIKTLCTPPIGSIAFSWLNSGNTFYTYSFSFFNGYILYSLFSDAVNEIQDAYNYCFSPQYKIHCFLKCECQIAQENAQYE